ncbi:hypothetical protein GXW82_17150 [Streptacidiphilus sp. 4-A2]|nr:hypothetical protein [Streptacidiphilus sp. 4-A2]
MRRLDLVGQLTAVVALGLLIAALIQGRDWSTPLLCTALAVAAGAAVAFLFAEARSPHPMLPLSLFRGRVFAGSTVVSATSALVFYGLLFVSGLYFQQVRGWSPLQAGLALLPLTATVAVGGFVRPGWRGRSVRAGPCAWPSASTRSGAGTAQRHPYLAVLAGARADGGDRTGRRVHLPAATAPALGTVDKARAGIAAAALNTARQSGSAVGVAAFGTLVTAVHPFSGGSTRSCG